MQDQYQNIHQYPLYNKLLINSSYFSIKKIFYAPLKSLENFKDLLMFFRLQVTSQAERKLISTKLTEQYTSFRDQREYFKIFHKRIMDVYMNRGFRLLLVIDQADHYFSLAREYFLKLPNTQDHYDKLNRLSQILTYSRNRFRPFILNSSQAVENLLIAKQLSAKQLYDYFDHQNQLDKSDTVIDYSQLINTPAGNIQLYGVLLFEISKKLVKLRKTSKENVLILRQYLSKVIKCMKQNEQNGHWEAHIRPHCIGHHINTKDCDSLIVSLEQNLKEKNQTQIINSFFEIKNFIQQANSASIETELISFSQKNIHPTDYQYRANLIVIVRLSAFSLRKKQNDSFQVDLSRIKNIEQMLPRGLHLDTYLNHLFSSWTFANFDQKQLKLSVKCSPKQFIKRSHFIIEKIIKEEDKYYNLLTQINRNCYSHTLEQLFQFHLNNFFSSLIQSGLCSIKCEQIETLTQNNQIKTYPFSKGQITHNINTTNNQEQSFSNLLTEANNNPSATENHITFTDQGNNLGLDINQSSDLHLTAIDKETCSVKTPIDKRASIQKVQAGSHQEKLMEIILTAKMQKQELEQLIEQVEASLPEQYGVNKLSLSKLTNKLMSERNIQKSKYLKIKGVISSLGNDYYKSKQDLEIETVYNDLKQLGSVASNLSLLQFFQICQSQSEREKIQEQKRILNKLSLLRTLYPQSFKDKFRQLIARAIFIKIIFKCQFITKQNLITFLRQTHLKQSQQHQTLIPNQFKNNKLFLKHLKLHYFFSPFNSQRMCPQQYGLKWYHIMASNNFKIEDQKRMVNQIREEFFRRIINMQKTVNTKS